MNRTIEQWASLDIEGESFSLMPEAIQDLQELARQRDELLEALELCMTAVKLAGWEGDFCMDKARAAMQSIKEQTK